jgi:hypothetical protein
VLNTNFDGNNWQSGWDFWGFPPWSLSTTMYHSPYQSITSTHNNQGPCSCNAIDARGAKSITVTFQFRTNQYVDQGDFVLRYTGDSSTNYNVEWKDLAVVNTNSVQYPANQWNQYTVTITDTSAFTSTFHFQFLTQSLNSYPAAQVWVDDVQIVLNKQPHGKQPNPFFLFAPKKI